jgi:hypothetical protein
MVSIGVGHGFFCGFNFGLDKGLSRSKCLQFWVQQGLFEDRNVFNLGWTGGFFEIKMASIWVGHGAFLRSKWLQFGLNMGLLGSKWLQFGLDIGFSRSKWGGGDLGCFEI